MDNINLEATPFPIRDCEDEKFQRRKECFFDHLASYGKTIPKNEAERMIAEIIAVLEQHHVTYNQAREILNLVNEALNLRVAETRI